MSIRVYDDRSPEPSVLHRVLELVAEYVTDLGMQAVPPSNPLYELYRWILISEVDLYIHRIGCVPEAPVELAVAFSGAEPFEVVGFVLFSPVPGYPDACGLHYMAVARRHRNKGVARAMMRQVIQRYPHAELTCAIEKVSFYEKLGFNVLDVRSTQVVMNTRDASTPGQMAIVRVDLISQSDQAKQIQTQLVARWGVKAILDGEKKLERQCKQLAQKAQEFVQQRRSL